MKLQKTYFIILYLFFIWSCNTDKKENKEILQETVKAVKKVPKSNDFRERLKATEPATEAQLKNWLPENLGDFKEKHLQQVVFHKMILLQQELFIKTMKIIN